MEQKEQYGELMVHATRSFHFEYETDLSLIYVL